VVRKEVKPRKEWGLEDPIKERVIRLLLGTKRGTGIVKGRGSGGEVCKEGTLGEDEGISGIGG